MICPECNCEDWRCEKIVDGEKWDFVYVCVECGFERFPSAEERDDFNF